MRLFSFIQIKRERGEIATTLAVIGVGLMLVGLFVGTQLVNRQTQTNSRAAAKADVTLCPGGVLKTFQGPQSCSFTLQTVQNTVFDGLFQTCVPGDWGSDKPSSCLQSTGLPSTAPLYFINCQNIIIGSYNSSWMACSTSTSQQPTATPTVTPIPPTATPTVTANPPTVTLTPTTMPVTPTLTLTPTPTFTPNCLTLLSTMKASYLSSCYYNYSKYNPAADLNKDGLVDDKDYTIINNSTNRTDQWCAQKMTENTYTCGNPPTSYNLNGSFDNCIQNDVVLPQSKSNIIDAEGLAADIGDVRAILTWVDSQWKTFFITTTGVHLNNFNISTGPIYKICMTSSKTWPASSSGNPTATPTPSFGPYPSIIPALPGKIVFSTGVSDTDLEVATMNADGTDFKVITHVDGAGEEPSFSPDGSQIVFSIWGPNQTANINKMNSDGTNMVALTNNEGQNTKPIFTKDGSQIIFESTRDNQSTARPRKLYIMNADGTNVRRLLNTDLSEKDASQTPDGLRLLFDGRDSTGNTDIYMVNMDGTNLVRLTSGPGVDEQPVYLPDGTGIIFAYQDQGSTRSALYQRMTDGTIRLLFDRTYGGVSPALSPDGTKVLFDMQGLNIFDRTTQTVWRLPQPAGDHFSFSGNNTWVLTTLVPPLSCPAACNYANTITTRPGRDHGDANCDGLVNLNDFGIWLEQYQAAIASEVNGVSPIIPADQRSANFACVPGTDIESMKTQIVRSEDFKVWLNNYIP